MTISLKTQKMLWGRSASRCSICRMELVMDGSLTDDESLVGECCHIVAKEPEGPRGESTLTAEQRDKYANLILLCNVHHKQIDDQVNAFPVDRLTRIREEHEQWVRQKLNVDYDALRDDELYASYVDEWSSRCALDNWRSWTSWVFGGDDPRLSTEMDRQLGDLPNWILGRVWPRRYTDLEAAFTNFRFVCSDFQHVFGEHAEPFGDDFLAIKRFYKERRVEQSTYDRLLKVYLANNSLIECLMLELTRAANLISHLVRKRFLPGYRLKEGVALVTAGPFMPSFSYKTYRAEYRGNEGSPPYPGIVKFLDARFERDFWFGDPEDNELLRTHGYIARLLMSPL
jgi:hypothetical protein